MSQSIRTRPVESLARTRIRRDSEDRIVFPRVVERAPRHGDVYALSKGSIVAMFRYVPRAYLYGLSRIELRARTSAEVGLPYGSYVPGEASIRLYSTPADNWIFTNSTVESYSWVARNFHVVFEQRGNDVHVRWSSMRELARFMFVRVLAHELGHHYDFKYSHKRKLPETLQGRERSADVHMHRMDAASIFFTAQSKGLLR